MTRATLSAVGTIDHVVIAVADLDSSSELYRRLGFTLSPKGLHSAVMGSANHTIMLRNDYFELLGITVPTERNTRWRQVIDHGGGIAGIALTTEEPETAYEYWLEQELGPSDVTSFSRSVTTCEGAELEARFKVVSLADSLRTGVRVFVCSQPTREAVWLPELINHANTALAISKVSFSCLDPQSAAAEWLRVIPSAELQRHSDGVIVRTAKHELDLLERSVAHTRYEVEVAGDDPRAVAITYRVGSLDACRQALDGGGMKSQVYSKAIRIAANLASNVAMEFAEDT